jgi:hypothetical protein
VFRRLAAEEEYGALADELGQVVGLVIRGIRVSTTPVAAAQRRYRVK